MTHPVAVATIVAELGLDAPTVAAALLHDAVEDTGLTLEAIEARFGPTVARVVDGVTKLDRLRVRLQGGPAGRDHPQDAHRDGERLAGPGHQAGGPAPQHADARRDAGVEAAPHRPGDARHLRAARAPPRHRSRSSGSWRTSRSRTLHPKRYAEIEQMVATRAPRARAVRSPEVLGRCASGSRRPGIAAEVTGRPKHLWSIYEKMVVRGKEFDEIHDLVGIRVVVDAEKDCWAALGAIHAVVAAGAGPVQGLHQHPEVQPLPVAAHDGRSASRASRSRCRSAPQEMHRRAEYGIAAHWGYKEQGDPRLGEIAWLQRIVDWEQETTDPVEFLEALKLDLEQDEVYVFTPKGEVITLPAGATPVDFAYAIHTEVGHRCIGAQVNGRLVPLDTRLSLGRHGRDRHLQGRRRPARRATGCRSWPPAGPQQDPPVVQPGAPRGRDRERAARS